MTYAAMKSKYKVYIADDHTLFERRWSICYGLLKECPR